MYSVTYEVCFTSLLTEVQKTLLTENKFAIQGITVVCFSSYSTIIDETWENLYLVLNLKPKD